MVPRRSGSSPPLSTSAPPPRPRALPLILFFGLVAFVTAELWQLFNTVPTARYVDSAVTAGTRYVYAVVAVDDRYTRLTAERISRAWHSRSGTRTGPGPD